MGTPKEGAGDALVLGDVLVLRDVIVLRETSSFLAVSWFSVVVVLGGSGGAGEREEIHAR